MYFFMFLTTSFILFSNAKFSVKYEPFDTLYSLSATFNMSLAVNISHLNQELSQTLSIYFQLHTVLTDLYNKVQNQTFTPPTFTFHLNGFHQPFYYASKTCKELPYQCELPSLHTKSDYNHLNTALYNSHVTEVHTNYVVMNDAHIYYEHAKLNSQEFIMSLDVINPWCEHDFRPIKDKCIHVQETWQTSYYLAMDYCKMIHAEPLYLFHELDSAAAEDVFIKVNFHFFWIGGAFSSTEYPDLHYCSGVNHNNYFIVYNIKFRCFDRVHQEFHAQPTCQLPLRIQTAKVSSLSNLHFPSRPENSSLSFLNTGGLYLASTNRRLPTLCNCTLDTNLHQLFNSSKVQLLTKINSTLNSLINNTRDKYRSVFLNTYSWATSIQDASLLNVSGHDMEVDPHDILINISNFLDTTFVLQNYFNSTIDLSVFKMVNFSLNSRRANMFEPQSFLHLVDRVKSLIKSSQDLPLSLPEAELTNYNVNLDRIHLMSILTMSQIQYGAAMILIDDIRISYSNLLELLFLRINYSEELVKSTYLSTIPTTNLLRHVLDVSYMHLPNGYAFLDDKVLDIFKAAKIGISLDQEIFTTFFQIPITKIGDKMLLYKMAPIPHFIPKLGFVLPIFESAILGITKDQEFAHLNTSDLLACDYVNGYLCNNVNLVHKNFKSCMINHFLMRSYEASNYCKYQKLVTSYFYLSENDILFYYVPYFSELVLSCPNKKRFDFIFQLGEIHLPHGCNISINDSLIFANPFASFTILANTSTEKVKSFNIPTPDALLPTILYRLLQFGAFSIIIILFFIIIVLAFIILTFEMIIYNENLQNQLPA